MATFPWCMHDFPCRDLRNTPAGKKKTSAAACWSTIDVDAHNIGPAEMSPNAQQSVAAIDKRTRKNPKPKITNNRLDRNKNKQIQGICDAAHSVH